MYVFSFYHRTNPCFPCNIAITNFLVSNTCEIRFKDVIDRTVCITRHNSADSVPTSNLVCIMEVAIKTTFCIAGIIYYTCNLATDIQCTHYNNEFITRFFYQFACQNKSAEIYSEKIIAVCNAVYFRLCIDLMHILPPVTAEGFDGSHHPRFVECVCIFTS